jgi:hypothetical protein
VKAKLSKAAVQLREQFDDSFPDRDRTSDGWIGDTRHAARKSDHNPDEQGWVRAIDVDKDLFKGGKPDIMGDLADQLRTLSKAQRDTRIAYIIYDGRICSHILNWKWRKYTGANKHTKHMHVSFKKKADNDSAFFQIPMLGGEDERTKKDVRIMDQSVSNSCTCTCRCGGTRP